MGRFFKGVIMIVELPQLPPMMQQYILTKPSELLQIAHNGQVIKNLQVSEPVNVPNNAPDDEQAYYEWFYQNFDLDKAKQMMAGLETEEERAKNTTEVPKWALKDLASFDRWLAGAMA